MYVVHRHHFDLVKSGYVIVVVFKRTLKMSDVSNPDNPLSTHRPF